MWVSGRRLAVTFLSLALVACGPWVLEPVTQPPTDTMTPAPSNVADRERVARAFDLSPQALVETADGFVFVIRAPETRELLLLLSRTERADAIDILGRINLADVPEGGSASMPVVCPEATGLTVRTYLFGQDPSVAKRVMRGLSATGGDVVNGLWVLAITDEPVDPNVRWSVTDELGLAELETGTGTFFSDHTSSPGSDALCG